MVRIFTGPSMVAKRIVSELNEIGIEPVTRNDQSSAALAGFGAGIPDQVMLFVREDEAAQSEAIVNTITS